MLTLLITGAVKEWNQKDIEELIHKIAGGDTNALAVLYEQTKTNVYGYILSFLKHRQSSEDAMQDTYVKIFEKAHTYQAMGKPMAWIFTIARNHALMHLRTEKRYTSSPDAVYEDESLSPEESLLLKTAMEELSDTEREVVLLSVSGFKHREIAELTNSNINTTLSRYQRAIEKLRCFMEGDNGR